MPTTGGASGADEAKLQPTDPARRHPPGRRGDEGLEPTAADGLTWLADDWRWWIAGFIVLLYLAGFNGQWRIEPDSGLYLSLARNLAEGGGYTYHNEPHSLAYPGLPMLLAGLMRLFGSETLWPAHVMMLLFAFAGLGLMYRMLKLHAGRGTAVVVTAALALSETYFRYAVQLRNDLPFLVGVMACLAAYESLFPRHAPADPDHAARRWPDWLLLLCGLLLVVLMRPTMWAFVPVLVIGMLWQLWRRSSRWAGAAAIVTVALLALVILFDPRRAGESPGTYEAIIVSLLGDLQPQHIWQNLKDIFDSDLVEALFGIELEWWWLNAPAGLLIIVLSLLLVRRRMVWGLWVAASLVVMVLVLPTKRYFLQILPLMFYAWWLGIAWITRKTPMPWRDWLFLALILFWVGPNISKNVGTIIEQRRTPFLAHYKGGELAGVPELGASIAQQVPENAWVVAPQGLGRVLTYYSGRRVIDPGELRRRELEHPIYIIEPMEVREPLRPLLQPLRDGAGDAIITIPRPRHAEWSVHPVCPMPVNDDQE